MVLPPGAGKTRVGIEAVAARLDTNPDARAVVLVPNTAIQAQWVAEARAWGLDASDDKTLASRLTCLTYQSLAVFEAEVENDETGPVVDRLHPNGVALFERIRSRSGLVLVLDECHHLLEVWGRLLAELLEAVDTAHVLALTATPPDTLTSDQLALVRHLFGEILYRVSVPAVVREGHLAPFDELVWLTTPTAHEDEWLATQALRFSELTSMLTRPGFGSVGFYEWLTARFIDPVPATTTWWALAQREPETCDAALRFHHAGLLALPHDARVLEQHRHAPTVDDWALLLGDWLLTHIAASDDPGDAEVIELVRAALPAVGYQWTRRGVRRGRSPVDRVLARSSAKAHGAVQVINAERLALGPRTRVLVLCDHERASATIPTNLEGVLEAQAGSAWDALETFVADPGVADLGPLLVTGSVVAGSPDTLEELVAYVTGLDPRLGSRLVVEPAGNTIATCSTGWSSRQWVGHVTAFFEAGRCGVLIGTRGLLGEGWNARGVSTLIDLTTATTLTAVVQTRGRALRTDPSWPDKVATNWTVVCVSEAHPKGDNDWSRLVRKHHGFYGVDPDGDIVDGVAHIHPSFSPYGPPPVADFDSLNAQMLLAAKDRDAIRTAWRVGEPYLDAAGETLRVRRDVATPFPAAGQVVPLRPALPTHRLAARGLTVPDAPPTTTWRATLALATGSGGAVATAAGVAASGAGGLVAAAGTGVVAAAAVAASAVHALRTRRDHEQVHTQWVRGHLDASRGSPSLEAVAAAVADALLATAVTEVGSQSLTIELHAGGEYRFRLVGSEADAEVFTAALDEAIAPIGAPRFLVSRYTGAELRPGQPAIGTASDARAALADVVPADEAWHPVPSVLGRNRERAGAYHQAWEHWVGPGRLVSTRRPDGAGILSAVAGQDPFGATTVVRRHWA